MKRKIKSVYGYLDYRVILNDDFLFRTSSNSTYSLRAYSRDLQVSAGFLSEVLRGHKELRAASGKKLFSKLGFAEDEMLYIESLISYKIANDPIQRDTAKEYIRKHHVATIYEDHPDKADFIKTAEHYLVFGITRKISSLNEIQKYTASIGIKPERVVEILLDLIKDDFVEQKDFEYFVKEMNLTIKFDSKILKIIDEMSSLLMNVIRNNEGIKIPNQVAQGLILGLDEDSYHVATEAHKHFIQQMNRLAAGSKKVDRFAFVTSVFLSIDTNNKTQ